MASIVEAIRRLSIQATTKGVTEAEAKLKGLSAAQDGVTVTSRNQERATQSMERRLNSIQRQYDGTFRATQTLAKVTRDLEAAEKQGLITTARKAELLKLAADRNRDVARSSTLVDNATRRLTSSVLRLVVAYLSWRSIVGLMRTMIDATIESERAQRQLVTVVESTRGAAGLTADELDKMATSLQRVTTVGDETIKTAQALLLTFTRVGKDVFPAATEAALNMSIALNTDLSSAAMQVGKALNDPIKGVALLGRAGVQFTAEQKRMVKAMMEVGDIAGAQRVILGELETQFGGTARAARGTLGGALSALKEAWDNLFEANGPESDLLRRSIESLITTLNDPKTIANIQSFGAALFNAFNKSLPLIMQILGGVQQVWNFAFPEEGPQLAQQWGGAAKGHLGDVLSGRAAPATDLSEFDMSQFYSGNKAGGKTDRVRPPKDPLTPGLSETQISEMERQAKAYDKLTMSVQQKIEASRMEAATLGMSAEAASRMRIEQELLNQAANDNVEITPRQVAELKGLAAELAAQEEATRALTEAYEFGKDVFGGFLSDLRSELMNGTSLWEAFGTAGVNALNKVAEKILGMAAEGLWDILFKALTGAAFGSLGNGIGGGATFGGVQAFLQSANGNVFQSAGLHAYANKIVDRPTLFKFANGGALGEMGEAGPEAIMPLSRNSRGQLGVKVANENNRGAASDASRVVVEVYVRDDGKLAAVARQEGGRAGQSAVRQVVPGMIDSRAPAAVASNQRDRRFG